jgi:colicin import membrane protein
MRPAEYSTEEIIAAGRALQARGDRVTGFALRRQIGGGNPTRIKQVWDEHVASEHSTPAESMPELPVELAEMLGAMTQTLTEQWTKLAREMNNRAVRAADLRAAEVVKAAGEQREQTERELSDAAQTVEDLEARLEQAEAHIAGLEAQLNGSRDAEQAQAVEIAALQERLAAMEKAAQAAAEHQAQEEARHAEHRKTAAAEALRCGEKLMKLEAERDAALKAEGQARQELAKLSGKIETLAEQNNKLLASLKGGGRARPGES